MEWLSLINLALAVISFKWAIQSFKAGADSVGWMNIFASALNAACFANLVL